MAGIRVGQCGRGALESRRGRVCAQRAEAGTGQRLGGRRGDGDATRRLTAASGHSRRKTLLVGVVAVTEPDPLPYPAVTPAVGRLSFSCHFGRPALSRPALRGPGAVALGGHGGRATRRQPLCRSPPPAHLDCPARLSPVPRLPARGPSPTRSRAASGSGMF